MMKIAQLHEQIEQLAEKQKVLTCYHDTYTLATHYGNVSTLNCNCMYVVTSNVAPPIYIITCKNAQQRNDWSTY